MRFASLPIRFECGRSGENPTNYDFTKSVHYGRNFSSFLPLERGGQVRVILVYAPLSRVKNKNQSSYLHYRCTRLSTRGINQELLTKSSHGTKYFISFISFGIRECGGSPRSLAFFRISWYRIRLQVLIAHGRTVTGNSVFMIRISSEFMPLPEGGSGFQPLE